MEKHEIDHQAKWLHIKYDGEDRDDECVNELSIYQNADEPELQMLVSNIDFDNISHDNTFALTKEDAKVLIDYLQKRDRINFQSRFYFNYLYLRRDLISATLL